MIEISLAPGDGIKVTLQGTDGEFQIHYDTPRYQRQLLIKECAGLPGNVCGAANAILYHEDFRNAPADLDDLVEDEDTLMSAREHTEGFFMDANGQVRSTALVRCFVRELPGGERVVITCDMDGIETGEFTFYETVQALQKQLLNPDDFRPEVI